MVDHTAPTEKDARDYLTKHNILPLFDQLCASLVYHKPAHPRSHLIAQLKEAQAQSQGHVSLLTDDDLGVMFQMFDPVGLGTISARQMATGTMFDSCLCPRPVGHRRSTSFSRRSGLCCVCWGGCVCVVLQPLKRWA